MLQVVHNEIYSNLVLRILDVGATPRHDDIRVLHGWLHKLHKGWLHESVVGLEHSIYRPATFRDVALQSPRQSNIVIRVHKDLQVQLLVDFVVIQAKDALKNHQW